MDNFHHLSNQQIYHQLGERITAARLNEGKNQETVAKEAGVSIGTIQNIESGKASIGMLKMIAILRALDLLDQLNNFIPKPPPQSIGLTNSKNQPRVRVASKAARKENKPFRWG
ncbi:MAG: helix-turn-helix transcriptional regulator [Alteromonadaceae bacterium]|nr:helix-turn-helix transcriptional regulator [Alteromonadaceae bacterium]